MKKMRYLVIAMVVAVAAISAAHADGFTSPKKLINITFTQALHVPGLPAAMKAQVDPSMLNNNSKVYVVRVKCNGQTYRITGTYNQWFYFFHPKWRTKDFKAKIRIDR